MANKRYVVKDNKSFEQTGASIVIRKKETGFGTPATGGAFIAVTMDLPEEFRGMENIRNMIVRSVTAIVQKSNAHAWQYHSGFKAANNTVTLGVNAVNDGSDYEKIVVYFSDTNGTGYSSTTGEIEVILELSSA